jgi:hypothetical protein
MHRFGHKGVVRVFVAALVAGASLIGSSAHATPVQKVVAKTLPSGAGDMVGTATNGSQTLIVAASALDGHHGVVKLVTGTTTLQITPRCVATLTVLIQPLLPGIPPGVDAASLGWIYGLGADGKAYYIFVSSDFGFAVSQTPGTAFADLPGFHIATCGVGSLPLGGTTAMAIVGRQEFLVVNG